MAAETEVSEAPTPDSSSSPGQLDSDTSQLDNSSVDDE
jgi:hypothetical protein